MLLGKRARPPIKRTTSMTGISVDHTASNDHDHDRAPPPPFDHHLQKPMAGRGDQNDDENDINDMSLEYQKYFMSVLSPRPINNSNSRSTQRRNSADFVETAHFLRTCGLCNRRLPSGRDIYMYMGDTAFCSLECRDKQMKQDERKEKGKATPPKKNDKTTSSPSSSKSAGKSYSIAAT